MNLYEYLHKDIVQHLEKHYIDEYDKQLLNDNVVFNNDIMKWAAKHGYLEVMKYLLENGCPWAYAYDYAADGGHLECLMWLHENGYPWDSDACAHAADGHLECLMWLHENGCPLDTLTSSWAALENCNM